jgi:hypothetical protein
MFSIIYYLVLKIQVRVEEPIVRCLEGIPVLGKSSHAVFVPVFGKAFQLCHDTFVYEFVGRPEAPPIYQEKVEVHCGVFGNVCPVMRQNSFQGSSGLVKTSLDVRNRYDRSFLHAIFKHSQVRQEVRAQDVVDVKQAHDVLAKVSCKRQCLFELHGGHGADGDGYWRPSHRHLEVFHYGGHCLQADLRGLPRGFLRVESRWTTTGLECTT